MGKFGLLMDFQHKKQYSGKWEETSDSTLTIYDTLSTICQVTHEEKRAAMTIIFDGSSLDFLTTRVHSEDILYEVITMLRKYCNSSYKHSPLLTEWE